MECYVWFTLFLVSQQISVTFLTNEFFDFFLSCPRNNATVCENDQYIICVFRCSPKLPIFFSLFVSSLCNLSVFLLPRLYENELCCRCLFFDSVCFSLILCIRLLLTSFLSICPSSLRAFPLHNRQKHSLSYSPRAFFHFTPSNVFLPFFIHYSDCSQSTQLTMVQEQWFGKDGKRGTYLSFSTKISMTSLSLWRWRTGCQKTLQAAIRNFSAATDSVHWI